jgi:glycosyltransferase involved in cell wall biosynthesis
MSLVSVVIPAHNRAGSIARAVSSVLAQTYPHLEAIVVNDGSTDETARVVEECARTDTRIRLIGYSQNRGAQAARNLGIRAARGEWIAFLDSDDEWLSDSLALRLQLALEGRLQVVHSECYVTEPGSTELRRFGLPPLQGGVYRKLLQRSGTTFPSLLVSREAMRNIGDLDETIRSFQEWDTAIRLAKYYRFGFVPEPTFIYHRGSADSISKDLRREAMGYEQVFTKHRWEVLRYAGPRALASHYRMVAGLYRRGNDEVSARRFRHTANWLWPFRPRSILRTMQRLFQTGVGKEL